MSKKVPEIRFKGFHDEWEYRKLGEVFEQTSEYINPQEENIELYSLTIEKGLTKKTDRYDRSFLVKKEDKFKKVNPNDFVYNPMNMTLGAVGFNEIGNSVAVSGYYITMKTNSNYNDQYFKIWLSSPQAINSYRKYATGSLKEKQRVQFPTFSQIKIKIPTFEEQQKIGALFKQLEDTILLQQKIVDYYQQYKKAMMQKMFPQKGERVPKLRFKGFTGEWEEVKLENVLTERKTLQQVSKDCPLVSFTVEEGVTAKTDRYDRSFLVRNDSKKYKLTKLNDIVYNPSNLKFGAISRNKFGTAVFSPIYVTFEVNDGYTPLFMEYLVTNDIFLQRALRYQEGTVYERMAVKPEDFLSIVVLIPSIDEQHKIGTFFEQLDDIIALHQANLENYKKLNKALLQRMLV